MAVAAKSTDPRVSAPEASADDDNELSEKLYLVKPAIEVRRAQALWFDERITTLRKRYHPRHP
jgi:hypothetical protein